MRSKSAWAIDKDDFAYHGSGKGKSQKLGDWLGSSSKSSLRRPAEDAASSASDRSAKLNISEASKEIENISNRLESLSSSLAQIENQTPSQKAYSTQEMSNSQVDYLLRRVAEAERSAQDALKAAHMKMSQATESNAPSHVDLRNINTLIARAESILQAADEATYHTGTSLKDRAQTAQQQLNSGKVSSSSPLEKAVKELDKKLNAIAERIDEDFERRGEAGKHDAGAENSEEYLQQLIQRIEQVAERVQSPAMSSDMENMLRSLETQLNTLAQDIKKRPEDYGHNELEFADNMVKGMEQRITELADDFRANAKSQEFDSSFRALENKLGEISQDISTLKSGDGAQSTLKSLEDKLNALTGKLAQSSNEENDAALEEINKKLENLTRKLTSGSASKNAQTRTLSQLQDEISGLTKSLHTIASKSDTTDAQISRLEGIEQRLEQLGKLTAEALNKPNEKSQVQDIEAQLTAAAQKIIQDTIAKLQPEGTSKKASETDAHLKKLDERIDNLTKILKSNTEGGQNSNSAYEALAKLVEQQGKNQGAIFSAVNQLSQKSESLPIEVSETISSVGRLVEEQNKSQAVIIDAINVLGAKPSLEPSEFEKKIASLTQLIDTQRKNQTILLDAIDNLSKKPANLPDGFIENISKISTDLQNQNEVSGRVLKTLDGLQETKNQDLAKISEDIQNLKNQLDQSIKTEGETTNKIVEDINATVAQKISEALKAHEGNFKTLEEKIATIVNTVSANATPLDFDRIIKLINGDKSEQRATQNDIAAILERIISRQENIEETLNRAVSQNVSEEKLDQKLDQKFSRLTAQIDEKITKFQTSETLDKKFEDLTRGIASALKILKNDTGTGAEEMRGVIEKLQHEVATVHASLDSSASRSGIVTLEYQLYEMDAKLDAMRREMKDDSALKKLEQEFLELKSQLKESFSKYGNGALSAQLDNLASEVSHLSGQVAGIENSGAIKSLSMQLETLREELRSRALNPIDQALADEVNKLNQKVDALAGLEQNTAAIEALGQKVEILAQTQPQMLASLDGKIDSLLNVQTKTTQELQGQIKQLLDSQPANLEDISRKVNMLVNEYPTALDSLDSKLSDIRAAAEKLSQNTPYIQLEQKIAQLSDLVSTSSASSIAPLVVEDLRQEIANMGAQAMNASVDAQAQHFNKILNAVEQRLQAIQNSASGAEKLENIEQQIHALTHKLAEQAASPIPQEIIAGLKAQIQNMSHADGVEQRISELTEALKANLNILAESRAGQTSENLHQIEGSIARVMSALEEANLGTNQITQLEALVAQIAERVENSQNQTAELISSVIAQTGEEAERRTENTTLFLLKNLDQIKDEIFEKDRAAKQNFESLSNMLQTLVGRLNSIEGQAQPDARARSAHDEKVITSQSTAIGAQAISGQNLAENEGLNEQDIQYADHETEETSLDPFSEDSIYEVPSNEVDEVHSALDEMEQITQPSNSEKPKRNAFGMIVSPSAEQTFVLDAQGETSHETHDIASSGEAEILELENNPEDLHAEATTENVNEKKSLISQSFEAAYDLPEAPKNTIIDPRTQFLEAARRAAQKAAEDHEQKMQVQGLLKNSTLFKSEDFRPDEAKSAGILKKGKSLIGMLSGKAKQDSGDEQPKTNSTVNQDSDQNTIQDKSQERASMIEKDMALNGTYGMSDETEDFLIDPETASHSDEEFANFKKALMASTAVILLGFGGIYTANKVFSDESLGDFAGFYEKTENQPQIASIETETTTEHTTAQDTPEQNALSVAQNTTNAIASDEDILVTGTVEPEALPGLTIPVPQIGETAALQASDEDVGAEQVNGKYQMPPANIGPQFLRDEAVKGNPLALLEIANRYAEGHKIEKDLKQALVWYEHASTEGSAQAQYRLGSYYEKGLVVKKDLPKAMEYYEQASNGGNRKAMHNLAVLYAEGADGEPNYEQAAKYFKMAAERGLGDSQFNLGILYARGLGIGQNDVEAYKWFAIAAQKGDEEAAKKRDIIENRLDANSLNVVKASVRTFRPIEIDPFSNDTLPPEETWSRPNKQNLG